MHEPLNPAKALDPTLYSSPEWYQFELEHVIAPGCQVVGTSQPLRNLGDLCTTEIADVQVLTPSSVIPATLKV